MRMLVAAIRFSRSPRALLALCVLSISGLVLICRKGQPWASIFSHYPPWLCTRNTTQVVFAIRSWPKNAARRHAIRHTMAHAAVRAAMPSWSFLFYMGYVNDLGMMDSVVSEISSYGDVLISALNSEPNNSVDIALDMMRWVEERCGKGRPLRLFIHANDTVFADPVALEDYSLHLNKTGQPSLYCKVAKGVSVGRDPRGVNFVPRNLFRGPVFPPYCEGDAFFIKGTHLGLLYSASLYTLHYALLPQYVTGHMAAIVDIRHVNISTRMGVAGRMGSDTESQRKISAQAKLFITGVVSSAWKDVWLYSLHNQTRHTGLEKSLTEMILKNLGPTYN
ncbi:beta-1,3-galactosyltransferase 9-like [Amblyomma americanum]